MRWRGGIRSDDSLSGSRHGGDAQSAAHDSEIRQWIYRQFASTGLAPSPVEIAREFVLTPYQVEQALYRLQREADALVLIPGSPYIWMAEPFSAVPTSFLVRSGEIQWWGNCIWDALGILALLGVDGDIDGLSKLGAGATCHRGGQGFGGERWCRALRGASTRLVA